MVEAVMENRETTHAIEHAPPEVMTANLTKSLVVEVEVEVEVAEVEEMKVLTVAPRAAGAADLEQANQVRL
jgi:hypothetical protein